MAQSQNTKVEMTIKATSYHSLATYGDVLIGDKAFEFYNERNPEDYVQIPWDEILYVSASVMGKNVTRFAIFINEKTSFSFSTRDNKKTLRAVRDHIGEDKMFRSPSFLQVVGRGLKSIPSTIAGLFSRK